MTLHVRCGQLFTAQENHAESEHTLIAGDDGLLTYVGPTMGAPHLDAGDVVLDYSKHFVMPGLIDVHSHLSYGNAKNQEDINLSHSLEFRALRGLFFAQSVLRAGITSMCSPGDSGRMSVAVRDAVATGLFDGPRITAAGRYISSHQSLTDWYPTWVGVPDTSTGVLVTNRDNAIEEIRRQVKDGVDCVKIAMDGFQSRPDGSLIAAFTQDETTLMVNEIHRLGKKAVVHARGPEAIMYSAKAGVDLIFHAYYLNDECIDTMLKSGSAVAPTLTFPRNIFEFSHARDPASLKGLVDFSRREYETACINLAKAKKAGVPMMMGSDSGFAVTPYGEWHAKELQIFVEHMGFSNAEALRAGTEVSSRFTAQRGKTGVLAKGRLADFSVLDSSPLDDITILQDKQRMCHIHLGGREIKLSAKAYDPRKVSDLALVNWNDLYTRERVAELRG
jgi:imidazolonepropionase-like amidohydrolase